MEFWASLLISTEPIDESCQIQAFRNRVCKTLIGVQMRRRNTLGKAMPTNRKALKWYLVEVLVQLPRRNECHSFWTCLLTFLSDALHYLQPHGVSLHDIRKLKVNARSIRKDKHEAQQHVKRTFCETNLSYGSALTITNLSPTCSCYQWVGNRADYYAYNSRL